MYKCCFAESESNVSSTHSNRIRELSQNTYAFRGRGGERFVTFFCENIGICTVWRYELCERSLKT